MSSTSQEMSMLAHILDLRKRLLMIVIGLGVGFLIAYGFRKELFEILMQPLCGIFDGSCRLITTQIAEAFFVHFKTALLAGLFISAPWTFFQIWLFVSPGLHRHEKAYVLPFVIVASVMFVGGALFGYFFVFPFAFEFFLQTELSSESLRPMTAMSPYFSFAASLLFAFGALFEIPVFVVLLNVLGVVQAKDLWKTWRYAMVGIFALSALLTPADPITMLMLGVPLCVLYMISLITCSLIEKLRRQKKATAQ